MTSADRFLVSVVFILVCVSLIATLPQTLQLLPITQGVQPATGELGFRWLREATLAAIVLIGSAIILVKRRVTIDPKAAAASLLVVSWLVIVAFWSITIKQVPALIAALGLRLLQYAPLALIGYLLTRGARQAPLVLFASLLRWYVVVQGVLAVYQVLGGTRVLWYRTLFGYRAFGTFNNYNAFGPTMAACALTFCIVALWNHRLGNRLHFGRWMWLAGLIAVTSGSRTAILMTCVVVGYYHFVTVPLGVAFKRALLSVTPLMAIGFYYLANESALSGRQGTSVTIQREARLDIWTDHLESFETPAEFVFGAGLGEATMAVAWLVEPGLLGEVPRNPHSTYLSVAANFGFVGLLAYLVALGLTLLRAPLVLATVFVVPVAGLSVALSFLEIYPTNALLFFLWGCVLGSTVWWPADHGRQTAAPRSTSAIPSKVHGRPHRYPATAGRAFTSAPAVVPRPTDAQRSP